MRKYKPALLTFTAARSLWNFAAGTMPKARNAVIKTVNRTTRKGSG